MQNVPVQHITKTPGICEGRACIAGHRIRVMDVVVLHEKRGMSPDEIVRQFPGISLADVHAALAYYFDNRQEIEDEFRKDDEWGQWVKANIPSKIPSELRQRMATAERTYPFDPVVEAYKNDIDQSLLRENLRRTVDERLRNLQKLAEAADALRVAGRRAKEQR